MRVLVIGGGGREHALVWKIRRSPMIQSPGDLFCVPGNPGIASHATCLPAPRGGVGDVSGLADLAREHRIDLTVVGPELPLALGLADEFQGRGLAVFGATRAAARIESSKVFAKQFMRRHAIPTAAFETFGSASEALAHLASRGRSYPCVVKADGLAAGKGVVVAQDRAAAEAAVRMMMQEGRFGRAGERIVIEDHLSGIEASFFVLTDGERVIPLAACQDYKRAEDGDRGPNTGGMGAYCPSTEIDDRLREEIMRRVMLPAVRGLAAEGAPYRGVLYAGLMLCPGRDGELEPQVLEFNARFGDPEAQVLMPRVAGDALEAFAVAASGRLEAHAPALTWREGWSACVVMASAGYPGAAGTGDVIHGLDEAGRLPETVVFHAGTREEIDEASGERIIRTAGGRVLAVSALGGSLDEAVRRAYAGIERIRFDGMQYRRDIGRAAVERLAARQTT